MADKAHRATDEKLEQMERHLSAIYSRAEKEIGTAWKDYLKESGEEIKDLQDTYEKAKAGGDKDEIRKAGIKLARAKRDATLKNSWYKQLTERTAEQIAHVNETALAYVNGELPDVYTLNYNSLAPEVDGVGGYSFTLTDADTVRNIAINDPDLLPYKELDIPKDMRWNKKHMNAEVLQGILQGESMDKIATRLTKVVQMDEHAAIRNARTMVTGAENQGRQKSYERAQKDGIILRREWVSTNDGRTRHAHHLLDGQIADVDKPFKSELGPIMFPGDVTANPANVYNCRCTLIAKVEGFKK